MDCRQKIHILEYANTKLTPRDVSIIQETSLRILINGRHFVSLACMGKYPAYLTAGFLFSCGIIECAGDITDLAIAAYQTHIEARVTLRTTFTEPDKTRTSGLGWNVPLSERQLLPIVSPKIAVWTPDILLRLADEMENACALYHETRGCHNSALCTQKGVVLFREDIGRHNAIDTIVGQCLLDVMDTSTMCVLSSGRIASEIVQKVVRAKIPLFASLSAATSAAVESARAMNLGLVGNMRHNKLWIYNNNGSLSV